MFALVSPHFLAVVWSLPQLCCQEPPLVRLSLDFGAYFLSGILPGAPSVRLIFWLSLGFGAYLLSRVCLFYSRRLGVSRIGRLGPTDPQETPEEAT